MSNAETKRKRFSKIKEKTSLGCQKANLQNVLSVLTHYSPIQQRHILSIKEAKPKEEFVIVVIVVMHK